MVAAPFLFLTVLVSAPGDSAADTARAAATDSAAHRVVRTFPQVEVRALLHDLHASASVQLLPGATFHAYPVDRVADAVALQSGVVAQAGEIHVRGGRAGETVVLLDGFGMNEPLFRHALELPLFAVKNAELVSGAPGAEYAGSLAGVLDMRTIDPAERPELAWRWQTDGGLGTHYDRVAVGGSTPLGIAGLGLAAAADATLDDTSLPNLRTPSRHEIAGMSFGWRADNRLLGFAKLAPVTGNGGFSLESTFGRVVQEPYDAAWTLDGWTVVPPSLKGSPVFFADSVTGAQRWRAADHVAITDDRHLTALARWSALAADRRLAFALGWLHTRGVMSVSGQRGDDDITRPRWQHPSSGDLFDVAWGDFPYYRESAADQLSLRGDAARSWSSGTVATGGGFTWDDVSMLQIDKLPFGTKIPAGDVPVPAPLDSLRQYHARAPGGYGYAQGRWQSGGMVLNLGLRAEYWTPGPGGFDQTLPWSGHGTWSLSPRLGIAYPISVRDAFSLAYVRMPQSPWRDALYDTRTAIGNRQPLGNPALSPATLIAYEATVKHLLSAVWAFQGSLFYRDVYGQIGARDAQTPDGLTDLRYEDSDVSQSAGFELTLVRAKGVARRFEAHYTFMNAWGYESRPEGDPYGPIRGVEAAPTAEQPLSWDRRHTFAAAAAGTWRSAFAWSWSTTVGSPLPWTPKPLRSPVTDYGSVNSARFGWTENTNVGLQWAPRLARGLSVGVEARNLFDSRGARAATVDGYPNPVINTVYDDYGAYRTETGQGGGAYWQRLASDDPGRWVAVHDPRLDYPPRAVRVSIGGRW